MMGTMRDREASGTPLLDADDWHEHALTINDATSTGSNFRRNAFALITGPELARFADAEVLADGLMTQATNPSERGRARSAPSERTENTLVGRSGRRDLDAQSPPPTRAQ